jgi:pimeloyl-ACP methyl ester carboxylesterase
MTDSLPKITSGSKLIDGREMAWLECGEGPLAICVHGFPDSAHTFRHLLPELAAAGYRAVAPWTRGYAPSAIPDNGLYRGGARGRDMCQLHDALGGDANAVLIGHDWGATAAHTAAVKEPQRWSKVVTMAVPPGSRVGAAFFNYAQIRRSSYMFIFQSPLAEAIVPHDDWAFIRGLWNDWSPGYTNDDDVAHFIASVEGPGHLSAALGYYRAAIGDGPRDEADLEWDLAGGQIPPQPTLYLHGRNDGCIGVEVADGIDAELSEGSRYVVVDDAGHFLHLEQPAVVNNEILDFVGAAPESGL